MEARRHPFDFDTINIGDTISAADCQRAIGIDPKLAEYSLKLLGLAEKVTDALSQRFNRKIVVVCLRNGLRVLTESERLEHADRQAMRAFAGIRSAMHTLADTDVTQLTADQRDRRDRALELRSKQYAAMKSVRRHLLNPPPPKLDGKA